VRERVAGWFDEDSPYLDHFGLLLGVTALTIAWLALVGYSGFDGDIPSELGSLVSNVLVAATLLLALRAAGLDRRRQRLLDLVVGLGLLLLLLLVVVDALPGTTVVIDDGGVPLVPMAVLSVLVPVIVVMRVLRHRSVSAGTVLGAISAYLLIPVAFFHVFLAVQGVTGEPFFGVPVRSTAFMYFSLTTLTTVGFGDLAPVSELGRLAATTEAMVGQVYLVTFVALIVGLAAQSRSLGITRRHLDGTVDPDGATDAGSSGDDEGPSQL
jgi:hypothetical protein